jgi:hypothetical protein
MPPEDRVRGSVGMVGLITQLLTVNFGWSRL